MRWFEGSIPAAIAAAKHQSLVFVVVITGDDDQSTQMISSWEDDKVADASLNTCVAIKVDAKSETCVQFSQIYPVVCIPSSFFIGENGIPLEVIAGSIPAEELRKRIDKVKEMHAQQIRAGVEAVAPQAEMGLPMEAPPPEEQAPAPVTALPLSPPAPQDLQPTQTPATESTAAPSTSKESLSRPVEEASGHVTPGEDRSTSSDDASASSQPDEGLDAKVERLTKQLEERREQKKKVEEEGEIKKEMERRKQGKEVLDFKKKQEDDKTKRILDERNKDKAEEKAARERVKQQIALDRADRAARYAQNHEELETARLAALQARQAEQEARRETPNRERSTRIQFRLPDGSSFTNQFPSESRLQEARQFAAQEVGNRYGNFSLATMFPRREFTGEDLDKTLLELELAPSASVVLLPQTGRPAHSVVQSSEGGLWALLGSILYPLLAVWRFLTGFLFSSPGPAPSPAPSQRPGTAPASGSSGGEPKRESLRKRTMEKRPEDFKKDGKIHRLRTQEDSEDDNNTWNGNSTQQM
ncbi:UBX domain-containing protein 4 isoform X1 [Osmerus mordax]|uniref:UBX domain-containing protein 4 isoform X1 n=1 Tax=Osmerus mordax TaxID=8014 RepID=UPI0035107E83